MSFYAQPIYGTARSAISPQRYVASPVRYVSPTRYSGQEFVSTPTTPLYAAPQQFIRQSSASNRMTPLPQKPFAASQVLPNLYLGSYDDALNISELNRLGITHVLNVANDCPLPQAQYNADGIVGMHLAIEDCDDVPIAGYVAQGVPFMHQAVNGKKTKIIVHCRFGVSRSAMMVIAYLMKHGKDGRTTMGYVEATNFLRSRRPQIDPNPGFVEQLKMMDPSIAAQQQQNQQPQRGNSSFAQSVASPPQPSFAAPPVQPSYAPTPVQSPYVPTPVQQPSFAQPTFAQPNFAQPSFTSYNPYGSFAATPTYTSALGGSFVSAYNPYAAVPPSTAAHTNYGSFSGFNYGGSGYGAPQSFGYGYAY